MRLVLFCVLLLSLLTACSEKKTADYGAAPDTDPAFAMQMAQEHVALGPRVAGSEGAAKAAEWITQKMSATNGKFAVTQDIWQENGKTFRNIHARYKGQKLCRKNLHCLSISISSFLMERKQSSHTMIMMDCMAAGVMPGS